MNNDRLKFRVWFKEEIPQWDNDNIKHSFIFCLENVDCLNNGDNVGILSLQNCNDQIEKYFTELQRKNKNIVDSDLDIFINQFQANCIQHEDYLCISKFVKIEQCTGRKDKNGKLIYEGDIIEDNEVYSVKTVVKWKASSCGFEPFSDSEICGGGLNPKYFAVIGNIHENPELLR